MTDYDRSQCLTIKFDRYNIGKPYDIEICPECKDHVQVTTQEINEIYREDFQECDCKNLILMNGKIVSQCCCYSKAHLDGGM